ncbi:hypothetical protein O181_104058 [Austropuccinia psidii MF-1]|uniref:Integrase catalytic domain-containing protein n=1 Tax=Austropuccinia psidii MF-1 TaxID=1389203 RepID=A0A9Q3JLI0_9BASI|nr:hypothetical protein [Austropuccinia psidii MF-1]
MQFGLTNAPASFKNLVNDIFRYLLDVYVVVYLDDIMVFTKSEEEHVTHVSTVLSRLRANNLFAKASKPQDGPSKSTADCQLATSRKTQGSSIFPWFCQLLLLFHHELFKKDQFTHQFTQEIFLFPPQSGSSQSVSQTERGFHHRSNASIPTIVENNASDYALGAVLSQVSDSGKHPIAFDSGKLIPEELNYEIHDKELLGIVWALKCLRAFLLSISSPFEVLTNHSSLQYFIPSKVSVQKYPSRIGKRHPGQEKTPKLVKRGFHWSGMTQFIKDYVSSCQQYSRNKNIQHKKFGLLKPLLIPNGPWICLSMAFITQLPLSNSFDSILVIVDRFSKMEVFIPTISSITSLDLAHLFINNIFSKNGLPSSIVSDRGPLFVSFFWTNLCQKLKISRDLSTAYHPETDGQAERVNQILEQYLWMYLSYHQGDWNTWLPLAEFAYNNSDHSSTKKSPFITVYGRAPQFDSVHTTQDTPAGKLSTKIQSVQQDVKGELEVSINRFKSQYSCLPPQWKFIHPVFHISLSEPVKTSTIPNRHQEPPPPIIIEEEEEWEVSQILD